MPKKAKELSALAVSKIRQDGRYAVGGADGLYFRVVGDSRTWFLRIVTGTRLNKEGKMVVHRRDMGLGSYPSVSLAEAREKARAYRNQAREGTDPLEARKAAKAQAWLEAEQAKTFEECATQYIESPRLP